MSQQYLEYSQWTGLRKNHRQSLNKILEPYLKKRSEQEKNPVLDFLFEYYKFRPSHLLRWSPGVDIKIGINGDTGNLPAISELVIENNTAFLDTVFFPQKRIRSTRWIHDLLVKTDQTKPFYGCFGMHEWAMVYRADEVRHSQLPLRLSDNEIADVVESRPLLCTHFDAFRFFTDSAKPLNKNELSRETFQDNEQPGCIHSNMDLYKWAYKLYPWISSELIREAFFLAVNTREIDMKASPYDLSNKGLGPIKIETEAGRKEYLEKQTKIWKRAKSVREKLIIAYQALLQRISATKERIAFQE